MKKEITLLKIFRIIAIILAVLLLNSICNKSRKCEAVGGKYIIGINQSVCIEKNLLEDGRK